MNDLAKIVKVESACLRLSVGEARTQDLKNRRTQTDMPRSEAYQKLTNHVIDGHGGPSGTYLYVDKVDGRVLSTIPLAVDTLPKTAVTIVECKDGQRASDAKSMESTDAPEAENSDSSSPQGSPPPRRKKPEAKNFASGNTESGPGLQAGPYPKEQGGEMKQDQEHEERQSEEHCTS